MSTGFANTEVSNMDSKSSDNEVNIFVSILFKRRKQNSN